MTELIILWALLATIGYFTVKWMKPKRGYGENK